MQADRTPGAGPTRRLAEFSASLRYEDLPQPVVAHVKRILLDSLGTALAATTLGAGCREVVEVMRGLGGKPESSIFGCTQKVAAPNAAFANGALTHALNYDPIGLEVGHVGVVCLPAPLALAQSKGRVSGREFLAAAAVAAEVTSRLTAAVALAGRRPSEKFLAGQLLGYFGAAAGAGRVLGLTATQMHSALGLALMQASGSMQLVIGGDPPAKAIYGAFPNHGGVLAALLAHGGLGAECEALEGPAGLYGMIYQGQFRLDALADGLGSDFLLLGTAFKPWPMSVVVHPFLEAASQIDASDIREVRITGHSHMRPWCEPLEERRRPPNAAAAANSLPFGVAKMLCHGDVSLGDFTAEGIKDERALAIAALTVYDLDDAVHGGRVRVTTDQGKVLEAHVDEPLGHPSKPVPDARLTAKFRDCCRYAALPVNGNDLLQLIDRLEELDDVSVLTG